MHHLSTPAHQLPLLFVDISFEWIYDLSVHSCIKLTALYSSHMCILTTSWIPCVMLVHLVVWCYQNCFRLMRICSCWPLVPWKLEWINCWCSYIKYKPITDHLLCARTIPSTMMTVEYNNCLRTRNCEDLSWDSLVDKYIIRILQLTYHSSSPCL